MAREITLAPLAVESGSAGERNASDDLQKALDILTNNTMIEAFAGTGLVAEIISEEMKTPQAVPGGADAKFILCTDPLDGSANVDANGALGMSSRSIAGQWVRYETVYSRFSHGCLNRSRLVT
jgi:fructose-1,6-bisphosphatase I